MRPATRLWNRSKHNWLPNQPSRCRPSSSTAHEGEISTFEATYATRGREPVFKVTSSAQDADLDRKLDDLGYQSAALTSVQTVNLSDVPDTANLPSAVSAVRVGPSVSSS